MRLRIGLIIILISIFSYHAAFANEILTWKDCLIEASRNHPDLISAGEVIKQSESNKFIAASQNYPQISADGKISTTYTKGLGSANHFSYGLSANQLLFDGFNTIYQIKAAKENINVSRESFRFISGQVRWRLKTAFIEVLKNQKLIQLAEDILKIRQQNLQLITLRYKSGMEHRGALLTSQANVAQAEFEIKEAKRSLLLAQRQLNKEMGKEEFSTVSVNGNFFINLDFNQMPEFKILAEKNPNYLKAVAQKNAAGYEIESSRAEFVPKISLSGDIGRSGNSWPADQTDSGASLNVSLPIFEGGSRVAQLSKAKSQYRQLQANEVSSKDGIIVSLQESWNALANAVETIEVQNKFMQAAEERSKIAEAQYSVGSITFDNWTIIQDDLVRQKKNLLDAQANALLAQANWIQAQGETLEYEE
jgi:outer membrane protein TolC